MCVWKGCSQLWPLDLDYFGAKQYHFVFTILLPILMYSTTQIPGKIDFLLHLDKSRQIIYIYLYVFGLLVFFPSWPKGMQEYFQNISLFSLNLSPLERDVILHYTCNKLWIKLVSIKFDLTWSKSLKVKKSNLQTYGHHLRKSHLGFQGHKQHLLSANALHLYIYTTYMWTIFAFPVTIIIIIGSFQCWRWKTICKMCIVYTPLTQRT